MMFMMLKKQMNKNKLLNWKKKREMTI